MKYTHTKSRLTIEGVLASLGRTDIPITEVSVTEGITEAGEPFVEVDLGDVKLSPDEERKLNGYLGDFAPEIDDLKDRLQRLENKGPIVQ